MVMYRCGYIDIYSAIIIGMFRYIIIIIYEVPTKTRVCLGCSVSRAHKDF